MASKDPYQPANPLQPKPVFIPNDPAPTVAKALANSKEQVDQAK
jgi:hypothetical protein